MVPERLKKSLAEMHAAAPAVFFPVLLGIFSTSLASPIQINWFYDSLPCKGGKFASSAG